MLQNRNVIWLVATAGSIYPVAYAAEKHELHTLPEIVVFGDPLSDVDAHIVQPVEVLTDEELLRRDVRSIGETVSQELGVSSADFGPSVSRPVIRGLTGSRVRVLEDGIGTMDVSTVSADHAVAVEPIFAEQVELFRGPATLLYGSGASGGIVNVVNNRILDAVPDTVAGQLYGHYDSVADGFLGAFEFDGGIGDIALHIDGMKRDTDDYDIPGFGSIEPDADESRGILENSDSDTENFAGGASYIGSRGFIGFSVSYMDNQYGLPGGHHHEEAEEHHEEEEEHHGELGDVGIAQEQTRVDLKAALQEPLPWLREVKIRWGYNDHEHVEREGGAVGTTLNNEEWEGRVEIIHQPLGPWDGVIGVQYRNRDFSSTGEEAFVPASELESIAVFAFEKVDFGALHVDLGLRYETQDTEALGAPSSVDHDLISVSGGATWGYRDGYELGFGISRSQRAPSLEELFSDGPHLASNTFEIGGPTLDDETSLNFDLYWRKVSGPLTVQANLFYNRIDEFVFLSENDLNHDGAPDRVDADFNGNPAEILPPDREEQLLLVSHVQGDADFWGFELEAQYRLLDSHRGTVHARVWTDYVSGELDAGQDLPRITPLRYGGSLDWSWEAWYGAIDVMRVTKQEDTALLETETAGYTLLTLRADYTLPMGRRDVTLFARGTNVLDEKARRHTSFLKHVAPLPGVSALVGLRATF